jgi:hypothetical protein
MGGKDYLKLSIEWHRVSRLFWPGLSIKIPFSWRGVKMVMFCSPVAVVTKWGLRLIGTRSRKRKIAQKGERSGRANVCSPSRKPEKSPSAPLFSFSYV